MRDAPFLAISLAACASQQQNRSPLRQSADETQFGFLFSRGRGYRQRLLEISENTGADL
jgi:hypothetical protein